MKNYDMEKNIKFDQYHEYEDWLRFQDREIVINDTIEDYCVEEVIMPIIKWNKEDDEREAVWDFPIGSNTAYVRKPITIYLNTNGGDVFLGLVIAETIKKSKTPVHIRVLSLACSMGSIILMSGHKRMAYAFSNVLIHDGSTMVAGSTNKVKDHMKFYEEKNDQVKNFVLEHTTITGEKYDEMSDREWWLTSRMALEYGIIDEII
jgi:ATP-dependent Clp protease protease subunit